MPHFAMNLTVNDLKYSSSNTPSVVDITKNDVDITMYVMTSLLHY